MWLSTSLKWLCKDMAAPGITMEALFTAADPPKNAITQDALCLVTVTNILCFPSIHLDSQSKYLMHGDKFGSNRAMAICEALGGNQNSIRIMESY